MKFYLCTRCSDTPVPYCYLAIDEEPALTPTYCPMSATADWEECNWKTYQFLVSNRQGDQK
jgi:hypothetical protein